MIKKCSRPIRVRGQNLSHSIKRILESLRTNSSYNDLTRPASLPASIPNISESNNDAVCNVSYVKDVTGFNESILATEIINNIKKEIRRLNIDVRHNITFDVSSKVKLNYKQLEPYLNKLSNNIFNNHHLYIFDEDLKCLIILNYNGDEDTNTLKFNIYSEIYSKTLECQEKIISCFKDCIDIDTIYVDIDWVYMTRQDMGSITFAEKLDEIIYQESYPYLPNINDFVNQYINSQEPVLLLVGPPGTGKTRLIRYILKQLSIIKQKRLFGVFTSDKGVVESSNFYINFLSNIDTSFMIIEDMDYHLGARSDGNFSMYNILSISDGLLKNCGKKKIILSTNLPNVKDIDPALMRPGRCFSHIKTRPLTPEEANSLVLKINPSKEINTSWGKTVTLADVYKYTNS